MSLLLDALKKAAEQKAEKSKQEETPTPPGDETVIDAAPEDSSAIETDEDSGQSSQSRVYDDETVLDQSATETRHEQTQVKRDPADETAIEVPEPTETQIPGPSDQLDTGEDETIIFADEDVSDFMGDPTYINREYQAEGDETDLSRLLDAEDQTELRQPPAAPPDDETDLSRVLDAEDQTELRPPPAPPPDDETDLSRVLDAEDQTELRQPPAAPPDDETDLSRVAFAEDQTGSGQPLSSSGGDETDLSERSDSRDETVLSPPPADEDQIDFSPPSAAGAGDETDLSERSYSRDDTSLSHPPADDDQTDISRPPPLADSIDRGRLVADAVSDDTDLSDLHPTEDSGRSKVWEDADASRLHIKARAADDTDPSRPRAGLDDDTQTGEPVELRGDEPGDAEPSEPQDLSLLLADSDQAGHTTRTSTTDPRAQRGLPAAGDDELALVDTTRHRLGPDQTEATESDTTSTTGARLDALTTEGTTTRLESTATRTYAPDNYDRTLMKLPTDDASRLFAGMKSDSDVVMTPDYAKKVFQSKSTAQRMQHLKIYSGIFLVLLLAVGVFGVFEFASQSDSIDTSLRPLKRDPMPGLIKPSQQQDSLLSSEEPSGVSAQTLDIIENAAQGVETTIADQGVIAGDQPASDTAASSEDGVTVTESAEPAQVAVDTETSVTESGDTQAPTTVAAIAPESGDIAAAEPAVSDSDAVASLDSQPADAADSADTSLEISTGSRFDEKQVLLRDAYAAYQAGNDARALELYNEVLESDPGNRNALLGRAAIYVQNGNAAAAMDDYQTLLLANPKDSLAMSSLISVANLSPQESESRLKLMIREEPESPYLNFALGNAYGAQNRWQEAQGFYFVALQYNPDDPNYAYNLAVSLEHIEQPRAAMTYYRRALDNIGNGLATFSKDVVGQRLEVLGKL